MARAAWLVRCPPSEKRRREAEAALRARQGKPPLESDPEPEELHDDLLPVWNAWQDLMSDRNGMGGSIPWGAVSRWCEDHGIYGEQRLRWCRLIRACDVAHMVETEKAAKRRRGAD
jgi:hypothetical protein